MRKDTGRKAGASTQFHVFGSVSREIRVPNIELQCPVILQVLIVWRYRRIRGSFVGDMDWFVAPLALVLGTSDMWTSRIEMSLFARDMDSSPRHDPTPGEQVELRLVMR